jgi:IS6 family transposase
MELQRAHGTATGENGDKQTTFPALSPPPFISTIAKQPQQYREQSSGHCRVGRSRRAETGVVTSSGSSSVFAGFRFPREVISVAVRWYLRYGLSCRDVEELLAERGVTVDHVTIYRWVQRFTPELIEAARPSRHAPGNRWLADETSVKVAGQRACLYRAIDQHGQVIDVQASVRRDLAAARRFFTRPMQAGTIPAEVTTGRAPVYPRVPGELIPSALHTFEQYANNTVEADHGRLKARLRR